MTMFGTADVEANSENGTKLISAALPRLKKLMGDSKLALAGRAEARNCVGVAKLLGTGTKKDPHKAVRHFLEASRAVGGAAHAVRR